MAFLIRNVGLRGPKIHAQRRNQIEKIFDFFDEITLHSRALRAHSLREKYFLHGKAAQKMI
jgi:hypothetical protein